MQNSSLEPMRVFRTAAWIWIGYLVSLTCIDLIIYANRPMPPFYWYHLINILPALVFLGLAYSNLLKTYTNTIVPLMILLISIAPIMVYHLFDLRLPPAPLSNVEGMVLRQLPVLFIGLVLVAWHYELVAMLLYSIGINFLEFLIVYFLGRLDNERLNTLYFILIVQTVSFAVVGIFINQLITHLRTQQTVLKTANQKLINYASTLETLTVSRERNRLARELHDTLAHTLSGLTVQLETTKAYWEVQPEIAHQLLVQALVTTRAGLDETRRALKALRASPLENLGLRLALQQLSESATDRGRLKLNLVLPDQLPSLSPNVEQCIYRIAQEALENVVYHANAKNLSLLLAVNDVEISLVIQDDGQGIDNRQENQARHFGLTGMRERAELAGGNLTIQSTPGKGTRIQLLIKEMRA
jgi:signal transduction histidine kinase